MSLTENQPRNDAWFVIGAFSKNELGLWNDTPDAYYIPGTVFSQWPTELDKAHRMSYRECWLAVELWRPVFEECGWKLTGYIGRPKRRVSA